MRCEYCDSEVTQYPENGICIHCGGRLPPKPAGNAAVHTAMPQPVPTAIPQPAQVFPFVPGVNCCPKCRCNQIQWKKRGFSWGLGILGFFLFPVFGIVLGFAGSGSQRLHCTSCNHTWKRH